MQIRSENSSFGQMGTYLFFGGGGGRANTYIIITVFFLSEKTLVVKTQWISRVKLFSDLNTEDLPDGSLLASGRLFP